MYNSYEDYIRSVLGYENMQNQMNTNIANTYTENSINNLSMSDREIEECYPEIYKVVYPMIQSRCQRNTRPVTRELIDEMSDEIYQAVEGNVSFDREVKENRGDTKNKVLSNEKQLKTKEDKQENRGEDRQLRNRGLQDLIKILLIRELLRRHNRPPVRPPMPGPRPPFPGGGINPGPRPPIMPRSYCCNSFYNDIYEHF